VITILSSFMALTIFTAANCYACDCVTPSEPESFKAADFVFSGKVIRIDNSGPIDLFTFKVEQSLKGNNSDEIIIAGEKSDCDFDFALNGTYKVYARKFKGQLFAGACSGTKALIVASSSQRDLEASKSPDNYQKILLITGLSTLTLLSIGLLILKYKK